MAESVLDHAAAFGAEWFFAFLIAIGFGILAKQLLNEYQRNNERKAELEERNAARQSELELKREERKRDELNERAQRDRERSEMEGRIAAQMERSNNISEGLQAAMESLRASTEALHDEIRESREHSHDMANKVDHIYDRVDLIYERRAEMINFTARIKNKTFWLTLIPAVLLLVQVVAAPFGYQWDFGVLNEQLAAIINALFAVLTILGIVTDPTTAGVGDSAQALTYTEPKRDE